MPSPFGGRSSWIKWFIRKPFLASGASRSRRPGALPACRSPFQVQMVLALARLGAGDLDLDAAVMRGHPHPVAVDEAELVADRTRHEQHVLRVDLPQPGVHRAPGMVHRRGPLGDGVQRIFVPVDLRLLERLVPVGQRVEGVEDALAMRFRRASARACLRPTAGISAAIPGRAGRSPAAAGRRSPCAPRNPDRPCWRA